MLTHLYDLLFVLVLAAIAWSVGFTLLRILRVEFHSSAEAIVIGTACGLGVVAYLVLGAGLAGLLTRPALLCILGLGVPAGVISVRGLRRLRRENHRETRAPRSSFERVAGLLLLLNLCIVLIATLTPPTANDDDSLTYHLAAPKVFLHHHRIHHIPYDHHSNFPFTMEMLYTIALGLRDPIAAKLLHFVSLLLTLNAVHLLCRKHLSSRAGLAAALIFAATPIVFAEAGTAYVDIGLALFATLTFYSLLQWLHCDRSRWWIPTALFGGLLMGTKYLGVVIFVAIAASALFAIASQQIANRKSQIANLLAMVLIAVVVASPWYVKNYLWTGNPVYPFAYNLFGGSNWSAALANSYWTEQKSYGDRTLVGFLLTPWRLSFYPFNSTPIRYEVQSSLASAVGPLYLMFCVPLLALPRKREVKCLLGISAFLLLCWFFIMQYNRYLIPCLALLSIPAGYAVATLQDRSRRVKWMTNGIFFTIALLSITLNAFMTQRSVPVALGLVSEEAYLASTLDQYTMCEWINSELPASAKIITYGEPRGFYLDRDYLWGDPGHHRMIDYDHIQTTDALLHAWEQLGVTHVLINQRHFRIMDATEGLQGLVMNGLAAGRLDAVHETLNGQFLLMELQ